MKYYLFKTRDAIRVNFVEKNIIVKRIAFSFGKRQHDREVNRFLGMNINKYIEEQTHIVGDGRVIKEISEAEAFEICL